VRQPDPSFVSLTVELDPKFCQFNGAIGAVDGTHIPAFIPSKNQKRFWSRKNNISQNIFVAVTFDGLFVYVLAGVEGSYHDSRLLREALSRTFWLPERRFYLADSGFANIRGMMIPYAGIYHLADARQRDQRPANEEELFNLRHAQLRTRVEQILGLLKRKWKIIRTSAPEYTFHMQIELIYALTGLHNFMRLSGRSLEDYWACQLEALDEDELGALAEAADRADEVVGALEPSDLRKSVAKWLFEARDTYLAACHDNSVEEEENEA
jgi:hypothetical protein